MKKTFTKAVVTTGLAAAMTTGLSVKVYAEETDIPVSTDETKELETTLEAASIRLQDAQIAFQKATESLNEAEQKVMQAATDCDQAEADLKFAQEKLQEGLANAVTEEDVETARRAVDECAKVLQAKKLEEVQAKNEYMSASASYNEALLLQENAQKEYDAISTQYKTASEEARKAQQQLDQIKMDSEAVQESLTKTQGDKEAAENSLQQLVADHPDIEQSLQSADAKIQEAKASVDSAESDLVQAEKEVSSAEEAYSSAQQNVHGQQDVTDQADRNVSDAKAEYEQATVQRTEAEILADPTTQAYQDEVNRRQQAKSEADEALKNAEAEKVTAQDNLAEKNRELSDADKALDQAMVDLMDAESRLQEKEKEIADMNAELNSTRETIESVTAKKAELEKARNDYENAIYAQEVAEAIVEEKQNDVDYATEKVAEKQNAVDQAQKAYDAAVSQQAVSVKDFYDYMFHQTKDMDWHISSDVLDYYIEQAHAEEGNGVAEGATDYNSPIDATSLENVLKSLTFIEQCNRLRAMEGLEPLKVSPIAMAVAESMANMEDVISTHWSFYDKWNAGGNFGFYGDAGEILAPGWSAMPDECVDENGIPIGTNPYVPWYFEEKMVYEYCRDVLGMAEDTITQENLKALPTETKYQIAIGTGLGSENTRPEALDNICQVGHYLIIVDPDFTVTGYGLKTSDEVDWWGIPNEEGTSVQVSYEQIKYESLAAYDDSYMVEAKAYTVEEYRTLLLAFIEYSENLESTTLNALNQAKEELSQVQALLQESTSDRDLAEKMVEDKKAELAMAQENYEAVKLSAEALMMQVKETYSLPATLTLDVKTVDEQMSDLLDQLNTVAENQQQTLEGMNTTEETAAVAKAEQAIERIRENIVLLESEKAALNTAIQQTEEKISEAKKGVDKAQANLDELSESLEKAKDNLKKAQQKEKEALDALQKATEDADLQHSILTGLKVRLQTAETEKAAAQSNMAKAEEAVNTAKADLEQAVNQKEALQKVYNSIADAKSRLEKVTDEVSELQNQLQQINDTITDAETSLSAKKQTEAKLKAELAHAEEALQLTNIAMQNATQAQKEAERSYLSAQDSLKKSQSDLEEAISSIPVVTDIEFLRNEVERASIVLNETRSVLADAQQMLEQAGQAVKVKEAELAQANDVYQAIIQKNDESEDTVIDLNDPIITAEEQEQFTPQNSDTVYILQSVKDTVEENTVSENNVKPAENSVKSKSEPAVPEMTIAEKKEGNPITTAAVAGIAVTSVTLAGYAFLKKMH